MTHTHVGPAMAPHELHQALKPGRHVLRAASLVMRRGWSPAPSSPGRGQTSWECSQEREGLLSALQAG